MTVFTVVEEVDTSRVYEKATTKKRTRSKLAKQLRKEFGLPFVQAQRVAKHSALGLREAFEKVYPSIEACGSPLKVLRCDEHPLDSGVRRYAVDDGRLLDVSYDCCGGVYAAAFVETKGDN
jgi:hypothetical protein